MSRCALVQELPDRAYAASSFELIKDRSFSFFLDGGMDEGKLGRYSFIGCDPFLVLKSTGRRVSISYRGRLECVDADPFDVLRSLLLRYSLDQPDSPVPFNCGAVGYFGYDLCHLVERLPSTAVDDIKLPECCLCFYDVVVAFDQYEDRTYVVSTGFPELGEGDRLRRAGERLTETLRLLKGARQEMQAGVFFERTRKRVRMCSNFTHQDYIKAVERAREYIIAGDIFQVNLSQRFEAELTVPPYELYRRLRVANPAPFACYLGMDDVSVAGSSPERFLRVRGDVVETRPVKGTRPRGRNPVEDETMTRELVGSPKDRAENVMIVDLERNDLGRVCRFGSVNVTGLAALEKFPTVYHLTSTVQGRLQPGKDRIDLLRATFPGGSVTGAPKVRSMEIIDELEPTRRGIYTGSIGYLGYSGEMDLNIVIRTFVIKGNKAYFQVGGGIVYDSNPEEEYRETMHKAKGLITALKLAPLVAVEAA